MLHKEITTWAVAAAPFAAPLLRIKRMRATLQLPQNMFDNHEPVQVSYKHQFHQFKVFSGKHSDLNK